MAKSSKGDTEKSEIEETAVEIVEDSVDAEDMSDGEDDCLETIEDAIDADIPDDEDDLVTTDDAPVDVELPEDPIAPEQVATPEPARSGGAGFLTLLLGGVAAGAIGYAIATYGPGQGTDYASASDVAAQADEIAALRDEIANAPVPDLSGVQADVAAATTRVEELTVQLNDQLSGLNDRMDSLERQPLADGTLTETAIAAYQAELDALREDVMSAASQAGDDLATARAEAERLEQEALAAAEAAAARAAINRVAAAVETGAPFADALADLDAADVPAGLADAAEAGVTTNAALVDGFPDAARAALATARAEGLSDDAGGIGGFLRNQFDVRSTSPQEGDGPDAVLSRAEAAVKEGRVADALAELEALPEVARAEMTDWMGQAQSRADVLNAISTLSETYQ